MFDTYAIVVESKKKRQQDLYDTSESTDAKAERIIRQMTRRVIVREEQSVLFLFPEKPRIRDICMQCLQGKVVTNCVDCPIDRAADRTLLALRSLEYVHIKAKVLLGA